MGWHIIQESFPACSFLYLLVGDLRVLGRVAQTGPRRRWQKTSWEFDTLEQKLTSNYCIRTYCMAVKCGEYNFRKDHSYINLYHNISLGITLYGWTCRDAQSHSPFWLSFRNLRATPSDSAFGCSSWLLAQRNKSRHNQGSTKSV